MHDDERTAVYNAIVDGGGEVFVAVVDGDVHERYVAGISRFMTLENNSNPPDTVEKTGGGPLTRYMAIHLSPFSQFHISVWPSQCISATRCERCGTH